MPVLSAPHVKCIGGREVRTVEGSDASYDRFNPHPPPCSRRQMTEMLSDSGCHLCCFWANPLTLNPRPPGCSGCTPGRTVFPLLIASEIHTHVELLITACWYRLCHSSREVQGPSCLLMHEGRTAIDIVATRKAVSRLPVPILIRYTIWYGIMIWYDLIRYDTIRYDTIRYDTIRYDMIWYDMIWYDMIW